VNCPAGLLVQDTENDFLAFGPEASGAMDDLIGYSITYRVAVARYVSRPPVAVERLALTAQGQVRYRLNCPHRDGTTHIMLEPVDFMAWLATLVPPPWKHLTRFHGVRAPHAALRAAVTTAGSGSRACSRAGTVENPTPRHVAMTWARQLNRVAVVVLRRSSCGVSPERSAVEPQIGRTGRWTRQTAAFADRTLQPS